VKQTANTFKLCPVFYSVAILYDLDISMKQLHKITKHKENTHKLQAYTVLYS